MVQIEAGPLADALRAFSAQSGVAVMFSERQVAGLKVKETSGADAPEVLLRKLLEGSGLEAIRGQGGAYVLRAAAPAAGSRDPAKESERPPAPDRVTAPRSEETAPELRAQTVIVTGTSLRGLAPESSPLQVYSRGEILGSGITSTEQFIRSLPQNFGGGSTEFTSRGLPDDGNSQRNSTFGSGANLRGIGAGATLTLVNGARLAPASTIGDFVDLSMIPVTAIERIEVLADGASSIYGGDAVAGVVNLILRDDFEGAETSLRYGKVTAGGLDEVRLSQAFGRSWSGGNLIGTYEYFNRDNLPLSDRPEIAAPTLLNGNPIADAGSIDLLPAQERHSLVLSGSQSATDRLRFSGTAIYSEREATTLGVGIANTTTVSTYEARSESLSASFLADFELGTASGLAFDLNYSEVRSVDFQQQFLPAPGQPIRTVSDSALWSAGLLANTELFDLPGGRILAAAGAQFRQEDFRNQQAGRPVLRDGARDVTAVFGEVQIPLVGAGNSLPGIRRLELNLSGRYDDYSDFGTSGNPKVGVLWAPADRLRLRSSYSTSFSPPKLGQSGALDLGAGVLPYDLIRAVLNIPLPDPGLAGVNSLITSGTADDLGPETSRTFTAGFDYDHTAGRHDLSVHGSFYDISFDDRLGITPIPGNLNANFAPGLAFANPELFPQGTVIFFPSEAQLSALIASLDRPVTFAGGATAVENIGFINNVALTRNLASTETSGLDFQLAYGMDADAGRFTAQVNANYILDFTRQAASTTPPVETINTLYNPVDLRIRGQLGLERDGMSARVVFNHTAGYRTDTTAAAVEIDSLSTVDLVLSYRFSPSAPAWLGDASIGVSVTNLFDAAPPRTPTQTSFALTGYDPANASPLGRFIAVDIRKSF